jgi:hypothetical protein
MERRQRIFDRTWVCNSRTVIGARADLFHRFPFATHYVVENSRIHQERAWLRPYGAREDTAMLLRSLDVTPLLVSSHVNAHADRSYPSLKLSAARVPQT